MLLIWIELDLRCELAQTIQTLVDGCDIDLLQDKTWMHFFETSILQDLYNFLHLSQLRDLVVGLFERAILLVYEVFPNIGKYLGQD